MHAVKSQHAAGLQIQTLNLSHNALTGSLPETWGNMTQACLFAFIVHD